MALQIADNFSYKGKKPLDARLVAADLVSLVALPASVLYDGIKVYVVSEKKYYVYDSSNTVDATLQQWRELTSAGILITNATIDTTTGSATKGHLILTLTDGSTIDCGNAVGEKGDKGDGFAIIKLYESTADMTADADPVSDGQMVAIIDTTTTPLTAKVYIRNASQTASGDNVAGYTFFCDLADAAVIQGPKGDPGDKGDKGDTPVITLTTIPATSTTPKGTTVTITTGADVKTFNVYDGAAGLYVSSVYFNANEELVFKMSDGTTEYNVGKIGGSSTGGCITMLGCFSAPPTTFNEGDFYYNTTTGLLHTATSSTDWDSGSTPAENMLYISIDDGKIYAYTDNNFSVYGGGGSSSISLKPNNAVKQEADGIYVKDLEKEINKLSIAQKTVNEVGSMSLLDNPYLFTTTISSAMGEATTTRLEHDLILNDSILNYDEIQILISMGDPNDTSAYVKRVAQPCTFKVKSIEFNNATDSADYNLGYATLVCENTTPSGVNGTYGNVKFTLTCWFKDEKTLHLHTFYNPHTNTKCSSFMIDDILGVNDRSIVIDPINYVDTTQGIEDSPVGHIISVMSNTAPKHYLACDGTVYNIADYPFLADHFKKEFGSYNYFGGDGTNTFAVPDLRGEFLRGSGVNVHANQGSGANVGKHQDATDMPNYWYDQNNVGMSSNLNDTVTNHVTNADSTIVPTGTKINFNNNASNIFPSTLDHIWAFKFTTRPTNTSVLYCIKYEPTYYIGTINGYEDRHTLLDGKIIQLAKSGVLNLNTEETLPSPLTDYDNIEFAYSLIETLTTVKDYAGSADGTVGSAIAKSSDNQGFVFDGTSTGEIHIADNKKTYPLTVEIMLKAPKYNHNMLMFTDGPTNFAIGTWSESNLNTFIVSAGTSSPSYLVPTDFFNDTIRTITVTYEDSITTTAYGDGLPLTLSGVSNHWGISGTGDSYIGDRSRNTPFIGTIYGVRIYNRILTPDEILNSHNANIDYLVNGQDKATRTDVIQEYDFKMDIASVKPQYQATTNIRVEDIVLGSTMHLNITKPNESSGVDSTSLVYSIKDANTLEFIKTINKNSANSNGTGFTELRIDKLRGIKNTFKIQ